MRYPLHRYFKTHKRLAIMLKHASHADYQTFFEDYLRLHEIDPDLQYQEVPYWIEIPSLRCKNRDADPSEYLCELREGYNEPIKLGTIRELEGERLYEYIDSIPFNGEQELQAEDGKCCYLYHGESYLRIWESVSSVKQAQYNLDTASNLDELLERIETAQTDLGTYRDELDFSDLPLFGGPVPSDTTGIWSWDETRVLKGDNLGFWIENRSESNE